MYAGDILKQPVGWVVLGFLLAVVGGLIRGSGQGLAETDRIKALGETVTANWIAEMDGKGFDGAALVAAARADVAANITAN